MHFARELGVEDVTQEQIDMVIRAIRDPMIGGWPLIHWEWVFSETWVETGSDSRGVDIVGEWPESSGRRVSLRYGDLAMQSEVELRDQ